jgi:hypothetical protein
LLNTIYFAGQIKRARRDLPLSPVSQALAQMIGFETKKNIFNCQTLERLQCAPRHGVY